MGNYRHRLMGLKAEPFDGMGYVKDGKIFHLDGISKGGDSSAWVDLVGGVSFPLVTGVTFGTDHVAFASGHGEFKAAVTLNIPKDTGTIEAVITYPEARMGILYTGKAGTMSFIMIAASRFLMATGRGARASVEIPSSAKVSGKVSQYSVFDRSGKCNGVTMTTGASTYWSKNKNYAVIGAGSSGTNYPYIGNIYAIRAYNRHLTDEERLHNLEVDNERFSLGINLGGGNWLIINTLCCPQEERRAA